MTIDPVTLEYIRRVGEEPTNADLIQLRAIGQGTNDPRDHRLLDRIIAPADERLAREREVAAMEQRLAFVESALSDDGLAARRRRCEYEGRRLERALVAINWPMTNREANARATTIAESKHEKELDKLREERDLLARELAGRDTPPVSRSL
jgi:hypothetical protein